MDADKIYDFPQLLFDLDVMLRHHGLQIATLTEQSENPAEFTIIVKENEE